MGGKSFASYLGAGIVGAAADGAGAALEDILKELLDDAAARGVIQNDITRSDLLDNELMGILTPRPAQVISEFRRRYQADPKAATDWFYRFSQDTDYIRRYRIARM